MDVNYIKQCRSCLTRIPESHCFSLDVIGFENLTFRAMFETALGYEILPHEPQSFCDVCVKSLVEWQSFKARCENAQNVLTSVKVEEPEECHSETIWYLNYNKKQTEDNAMDSEQGIDQQNIENETESEGMTKIILRAFVKKYYSEPLKLCRSLGFLTIEGRIASEIMHKICLLVNRYLKREIMFNSDGYEPKWSESEEEDIERFISFQDLVAKKAYTRPNLNIFKHWCQKRPFLFIYPYGKNTRTIHQFRMIENTLLNKPQSDIKFKKKFFKESVSAKTPKQQKSRIKTSKKPEKTLENTTVEISVPEDCLELLYRIKFDVLIRSFRKQSKKTALQRNFIIGGRDLSDFKQNLWIAVKPFLVRGIDLSDETSPSWHTDLEPCETDMKNYVDIRNVSAKRLFSIDSLNSQVLKYWYDNKLSLCIYPYSKNVDTAAQWEIVKRFVTPIPDTVVPKIRPSGVEGLVSKLKVAHEAKYPATADTNWIMWANYIDCFDVEQQEKLLQEGPPTQFLSFFDTNFNSFPTGHKTESVFSFSALAFLKQTKFSRNHIVLGRFTFRGDTVEEIQNSMWQQCCPFLVREIIFNEDGKPEWSAKEYPTREDLSKFVYISDKSKKRPYTTDILTEERLKRWEKKQKILYIFQFTPRIKTVGQFQTVYKNLLQFSENSETCVETEELIERLQEQHQSHLISFEFNWRMWAHYLQGFHKSNQLDLIKPPKELSHLFVNASLQELRNQIPEEIEESGGDEPVDPYKMLNLPKDADRSQRMTCPFEGCFSAFKISSFGHHYRYCRFNPDIEYTYRCKFERCKCVFAEKWNRKQHEVTCRFNPNRETKELKQCPYCEKMHINIKKHIERKHTQTKPVFTCDLCGTQLNTKGSIKMHMNVHIQPKYMCDKCPQEFKAERTLRDHIARDHTDNLKLNHMCKYCSYKTHASYNLSRHMKLYHDSTRQGYTCSECGKLFLTKSTLRAHLAVHADTEFSCKVCDRVCRTERALNNHMTLHQEWKYECPVCQMKRRSAYEVRMHCQRKHPNYKLPPKFTIMKLTSRFNGKTLSTI